MDKAILLGIAALAGAGAWYAAPAVPADAVDAPLVIARTPAEVIGQLRATPLQNALRGTALGTLTDQLELRHDAPSAHEDFASLWLGSQKIVTLTLKATRDGSKTDLAIAADLAGGALARQSPLTANDRKVLADVADLALTNYLANLFNGQALGSRDDLRQAIDQREGFDLAARAAFDKRASAAVASLSGIASPTAQPATSADALSDWYGEAAADSASPSTPAAVSPPADPAPTQ